MKSWASVPVERSYIYVFGFRGQGGTLHVKPRASVPVERSRTLAGFRSPWIRPEVCR